MKIKNRFIAGAMALLIGCSTLFNAAVTVSATGTDNTSAETTVQEGTIEPASTEEELPELAEVLDALDADEIVTAGEVNLSVGDTFDPEMTFPVLLLMNPKSKYLLRKPLMITGRNLIQALPVLIMQCTVWSR